MNPGQSAQSSDSIEHYLHKLNEDTSLEISAILEKGPLPRVAWLQLFLSPCARFFHMYLSEGGYKKGISGFIRSVFDSIYVLVLLSKIWEYRFREEEGKDSLPPITKLELERFNRL
jgi:hypothetical protein